MESANRHHQHQLQDQLVAVSSPLLAAASTPSCFAPAPSNHAWTPNIILNTGSFNPNFNGIVFNPRDSRQKNDSILLNSPSFVQDLGFHWAGNAGTFPGQSADNLHPKIKEELSESFPKFTEMTNSSTSSCGAVEDLHSPPTTYIRSSKDLTDLSEKLFLKSLSSSACQINGLQLSAADFYANAQSFTTGYGGVAAAIPSRGHFSQIFPTINISNLSNQSSPIVSSSLDMNLQALDLLTSARFSGSFSHPSNNNLGLFRDGLSFGLDHLQQSTNRPSNSPTKISAFTNGVAEVKRPCSFLETKATPKKSRLEPRASCPPIKVRKEKLGDRIAALQQLVAPFGKTDTASVLMEAIGYIKFLQNQVETLSVPYMKSSRNKSSISMQAGSTDGEGSEEARRDLRSRGLCLVPLSCMSYVTTDCGGGGIWPPPSFGGGT